MYFAKQTKSVVYKTCESVQLAKALQNADDWIWTVDKRFSIWQLCHLLQSLWPERWMSVYNPDYLQKY